MRKFVAVSASVSVGLGVSACAGTFSDDVVVETVIVTETAAESDQEGHRKATDDPPFDASQDDSSSSFRDVLINPPVMEANDLARFYPTGTYSYAMVEATGDSRPDMLLKVNGSEFSRVLLYTTTEGGDVVASQDVLIDGAASSGGGRARLVASTSGDGVHQIDWQSISPTATSTRYRLEGDRLVKAGAPTTFEQSTYLPDHQEISWRDASDRSGLDEPVEVAAPRDHVVFRGLVTKRSTSEVMKGKPSPNGEPESNRYYVLVLDEPMYVTSMRGTPLESSGEVSEVRLGAVTEHSDDSAKWDPLVGSRVTITAGPNDYGFPSDTRLPVMMLGISSDLPVEKE